MPEQTQTDVAGGLRVDPSMFVEPNNAPAPIQGVDAVSKMAALFRTGQLSADDFIQRYGQVATANKAAQIEGLHEYISPEAIQERKQKIAEETAKSQAATGLVQPMTQLAQTNLDLQNAAADDKGIQAFLDHGAFYGAKVPRDEAGKIDKEKASQMGAYMARDWVTRQVTAQQLGGIKAEETGTPGVKVRMGPGGFPVSAGHAARMIDSVTTVPDVNALFNVTPGSVVQPNTPVAPAEKPMLDVGNPDSSTINVGPSVQPIALAKELEGNPAISAWRLAAANYGNILGIDREIKKNDADFKKKGLTSTNSNAIEDLALISNFIKLYDPQAVIREFKFDKVVASKSVADQLQNALSLVLKKQSLTPAQREQILHTSRAEMLSKETQAKDLALTTAAQAHAGGVNDLTAVISPNLQSIIHGKPEDMDKRYAPASNVTDVIRQSASEAEGQISRGTPGTYNGQKGILTRDASGKVFFTPQ